MIYNKKNKASFNMIQNFLKNEKKKKVQENSFKKQMVQKNRKIKYKKE